MELADYPADSPQTSLSKPILNVSPGLVLGILMAGDFVILLDTTIVNVAIPSLTSSLHANLSQVVWVLNAYMLTFGVLLLVAGRLGDIFGPKKLFVGGMLLFTAASLACGLSQTPEQLIIFRVVQAIGGAILTPQPGTIITAIFPPEKRGQAFGVMGAVIGVAALAGPTLGGILTSAFSWRAIFFPNVPIGLLAATLAFLTMPELKSLSKRGVDFVGMIIVSAALFLGMYAIIEGPTYSWGRISSPGSFTLGSIHGSLISIPTIGLVSILLLILFVLWETRQDEPLLPLSLFRDRNFDIANVVLVTITFCMIGLMVTLPLFLQSVLGLTPLQSGFAIVPNAILVAASAPLVGRLTNNPRVPVKFLPVAGLLLYAIGAFVISRVASLSATGLTFILPLVLSGIGVGLITAPVGTLAMDRVAVSAAGAASGFINTVRQLGGAIGAAIVAGAVLEAVLTTELHKQAVRAATKLPGSVQQGFIHQFTNSSGSLQVGRGQTGAAVGHAFPPAVQAQVAALATQVFHTAFLHAFQTALLVPVGAAVAGAIIALGMKPLMERGKVEVEPVLEAEAVPVPALSQEKLYMAVPLGMGVSDTFVMAAPTRTQIVRPGEGQTPDVSYLQQEGTNTRYPVTDTISFGRLPRNTIVIMDEQVSRRHAEIVLRHGAAILRDLQSANGTFVNGERISGERTLRDGDTVAIGDVKFVYHHVEKIGRAVLVAVGQGRGQEYPITSRVRIGREPTNDIVVRDPKASRRHAELFTQQGRVFLRDLDSLNGTHLNGQLVLGDQPLYDGDTVSIGDTAFVYHSDAPVPAAP